MPSVLRHRAFRNVWLAAFGSSVGTWMESVGVQWLMAEQTRSPAMAGYLAAAQFGPVLLLGIFAGVVADRVDRRRLLLVTQAVMMLVAAALAVTSYTGHATPWMLIALGLAQGLASAFNIPAWQVLIPRLVPREELLRAVTLNGMQFNMARVIGPAAGGALMAWSGPTVLFVVNTLSFIGVLIAVAATPADPRKPTAESPWASVRAGLAFVFGNRGPRAVFLALVIYSTLAVPVIRMLPLFTKEVYGAEEKVYGVLVSLLGAGAVIGGLVVRFVPVWYPKHHFIPLSITLGGMALALFSTAGTAALGGALIVVVGVFWLWTFTTAMGAMQMLAPDELRGRAMSICNTATFGATPIGTLLAGALGHLAVRARFGDAAAGEHTGFAVQAGVGALAAALTAAGLAMLVWRVPEVDGLSPGQPGHERRPGLLRGITGRGHRPGPTADL